jgi:hypothetical protein
LRKLPVRQPVQINQLCLRPTAYRVVERGANHRVWQREIYEKRPDGTIVPHVEKITELATGMHYWKNGQWVESQGKDRIQF